MSKKQSRPVASAARAAAGVWRWLASRGGVLLLAGKDSEIAMLSPRRLHLAWAHLFLISAIWGVAAAGLWQGAYVLFELSVGAPLMSAAAVLAGGMILPWRGPSSALGRMLAGRQRRHGAALTAAIVVVLALELLGLRRWDSDRFVLRPELAALALAPVWGGWAMVVLPRFSSRGRDDEPCVRALARGCGALVVAAWMGLAAAATTLSFNFLGWWALTISATAVAAAIGGGMALTLARGRVSREVLLAGNMLTQVLFLAAYLANR